MIKEYNPNPKQYSLFENIPKRIFWKIAAFFKINTLVKLFINKNSYLVEQGWLKSEKLMQSVDKDSKPLPWLTYPLVNFIEGRLNKNLSMFEYGSGNSTLWFAERVKSIYSVEHDKKWINQISRVMPNNVKLVLKEVNEPYDYGAITFMNINDETPYSMEIKNSKNFYDIVLIDGIYRSNCVVNAVDCLTDKGIIIVDNIDYIESYELSDFLLNKGFKKIEFWGMCSLVYHDSCTAIFYKENNCLDI